MDDLDACSPAQLAEWVNRLRIERDDLLSQLEKFEAGEVVGVYVARTAELELALRGALNALRQAGEVARAEEIGRSAGLHS